ncbi:MAG: hypothetical protein JST64_05700 [Actinobacteria bacterium]|nr:hypothetical protein [Actinomycetota bacterium]
MDTSPALRPPPIDLPWRRPDIAGWLSARRNDGDTPAGIASTLIAAGWDADTAADTALHSLRRSDRHRVLYGVLCWSIGLGSLGLATGLHQVLSAQHDHAARAGAALSFTIAVVLLPLAALCAWSATRLEQRSPHAVWSPTRRMWFGTLAACTAVVGLARLIAYVYRMIAAMTGARHAPLAPADQFQVLVSLAISVPLLVWSFLEWRRSDVVISGIHDGAS